MRLHLLVVAIVFLGCPSPNSVDGGSGGGSAQGGGAGGSSAGGTGGGTGAGSDAGFDAGPPPFDAGSITMTETCAAYINALCAYYQRCTYVETEASCVSLVVNRTNPWFQRTCLQDERAAVDAGRAAFDGFAAAACVHALRETIGCTQAATMYATECQNLIVGRVTTGPCAFDFECATGSYCDSSLGVCPGQCRVRKSTGADAGSDHECAMGSYAYQGRCRPYALTGLSCAPLAAGGPNQSCRPGDAACNATSMTCVAPRQEGYPCAADAECAFPLRCSGDGHCVRGAALGQSCGYGIFGAPPQPCKLDLQCENPLKRDGGTCVMPGGLDAGCFNFFECAGNTVCRGVEFLFLPDAGVEIDAGHCESARLPSAPCDPANVECDIETAFCQTDAGAPHCSARKDAGAGCFRDDECTPLEACVGGVCRRGGCTLP